MVEGKTEFPKLKTESFQVVERLEKDVDIDLFSKTVIPVVGDEHHGHPVIAGVTRNLFRATAIYNIIHKVFCSCRTFRGQANACRVRQKQISFVWRKKGCDFSSAGHHCGSDHTVFPVATIKSLVIGIILLFVGTCIIPAMAQTTEKQSSRGTWLYVGGCGPGNYTKIQDAFDNTSTNEYHLCLLWHL